MKEAGDFRRKYSKTASKTLDRVDVATAKRLRDAIKELPKGDIKRLAGKSGLWRLVVGGWRVLFYYGETDENGKIIIQVEHIEPRWQVYKRLN